MIPRYTPTDMEELFSSAKKYQTWLHVEVAACRAMENEGRVPKGTSAAFVGVEARIDPSRIDTIEKTTKHDVIAFLTHIEELVGPPARWLHLGMTSSDVLDTSTALLMKESTERLIARLDKVLLAFSARVREHVATPIIGRSHGIFAEPTTFGVVLAGHYAELKRGRERLQAALSEVSVGKIAGAVGTYAHLTPAIELETLSSLGLSPETVATQIVARDRHAILHAAMALVAAAIERFATNVRHWQRNEVQEAEEHFTAGQKGSSAMPHKRNPVLSENLCGLARVVRATVTPALENVALWHERDISHSSVERMFLPDAVATLAFMLDRTEGLIRNLVVYPENMKRNLDRAGGLWASEGILLALVKSGLPRQEAYVFVQRNAMRAFHGDGTFEKNLCADPEISARLSVETIKEEFSLQHAVRHAGSIVERALAH